MTTTKRRTLFLIVGGLVLAVGTPIYLALARPGLRGYLLQPSILLAQAFPYLVAAGLWLPWNSPAATTTGQRLACFLLLVAVVLYVPMLTGLWATGGDMVGLGVFLIAAVTTVSLIVVTLIAFGILWLAQRGRRP